MAPLAEIGNRMIITGYSMKRIANGSALFLLKRLGTLLIIELAAISRLDKPANGCLLEGARTLLCAVD
jgi:hypothetical protein